MGEKRAGDNLRHLCSRCIYRSIYLPSVRNIAGAGCKNRSPSLYTADDPAEYDDIYRKEWKTDRELQRFLGAPYSYLKEQGVENIYLLYGNGPMLPREQDALLEGHYFERVDRRIQEMVTEMEGVFIPVYYAAGYIVENQWLYYFGTYGVEMQMNTGVKLELDTITMFTGPQYARNREMECMLTTKVFTREQHCNIQIKKKSMRPVRSNAFTGMIMIC